MPARITHNPGAKLTYDDLVRMPHDGLRHELIDGEHVVSPAPGLPHQAVVGNIFGLLWSHLRTTRVGVVYTSPVDVVFTRHDVAEPDVVYLSRARARMITGDKRIDVAPDLVIEVSSPSTAHYDQVTKRALYERMGVSEYWFIDLQMRAVTIYRCSAERTFARPIVLEDSTDVVTTPLLPDLALRLADLFEHPATD